MADKYPKHQQEDHVGLEIKADFFTGTLNGSALDPDVVAIVNLTDSSGGTSGGNTVAAIGIATPAAVNSVTDASASTTVSVNAAITYLNTQLTAIRNDVATLTAKLNALLTALK